MGHLRFAHLDDGAAENRLKAFDHPETQILFTLLHPGDCTLAGSQLSCQLPLRPALFAPGVAEQKAYMFWRSLSHIQEISQMSYDWHPPFD